MIVEGHSAAVNKMQQVNGQLTAREIYRYTAGNIRVACATLHRANTEKRDTKCIYV